MTWVSTLNMISLLGATPVMVDVDRDTLMVTPEIVEAAITPRTKAIIPVHYAGPRQIPTLSMLLPNAMVLRLLKTPLMPLVRITKVSTSGHGAPLSSLFTL